MNKNKTLIEKKKWNICLPTCHVTITNAREPLTNKCDTSLLKYLFSNLRGISNKNIIDEKGSYDKNIGEFVHFNVFERQTPFKVTHGNHRLNDNSNKMNVFISSWCNVETLLKPEMILVNPVVKCSVATWLMTDFCVNVHKTLHKRKVILERKILKMKNRNWGESLNYESIIAK